MNAPKSFQIQLLTKNSTLSMLTGYFEWMSRFQVFELNAGRRHNTENGIYPTKVSKSIFIVTKPKKKYKKPTKITTPPSAPNPSIK